MKVEEYLKTYEVPQVTFIKARSRKDAGSPFYHSEYQTTPILYLYEVPEHLKDYYVITDKQAPIDWSLAWLHWFHKGDLTCLLIISEADLKLLIPNKKQVADLISSWDRRLKQDKHDL